jgi:hypothetical protein
LRNIKRLIRVTSRNTFRFAQKGTMASEKIHPTQVISYSGYRGEERPASFEHKGGTLNVEEIIERWVERDVVEDEGEKRCFRVKADDGHFYSLFYDSDQNQWFVRESPS